VSPPAAGRLTPFHPCTPPCVYQTHNVEPVLSGAKERRGHSSAWRSGVGGDASHCAPPHPNGHPVVKVQDCRSPSLRYPSPVLRFRVNGSHEAVLGQTHAPDLPNNERRPKRRTVLTTNCVPHKTSSRATPPPADRFFAEFHA